MRFRRALSAIFFFSLVVVCDMKAQGPQPDRQETGLPQSSVSWRSPAKLHKTFGKKKGEILIEDGGVRFQPSEGSALIWPFLDIQTFSLLPHKLVIKTYKNRADHLPGMQRFRFELTQDLPPTVAAELARGVARPSQNGVPNPAISSLTEIPAHHRTGTGGTNGMLRFREDGLDYITSSSGDSRSWRWADLQVLSSLSPYVLLVSGYRDFYTFDLKKPLSRAVLDRSTNAISSHDVDTHDQSSKRRVGSE
jgi:hypothetical protein